MKPEEPVFPAQYLTPLLLLTVALFFTAIFGARTILLGKTRFFFNCWQIPPCLLLLFSTVLMPRPERKTLPVFLQDRLFLAAFGLLALSPFPTWAVRSTGNTYFELCSTACLAMTFWVQLEICLKLEKMGTRSNETRLAGSAQKTRFQILWFEIIPAAAVYSSGVFGLFSGTHHSLAEILRIWNYGQVSVLLRIFLYWGLLQFLLLCLYAAWVAARQQRKLFEKMSV